jgi:penicillin-binding protein 2
MENHVFSGEVPPVRFERTSFRIGLCRILFLAALAAVLVRVFYLEWSQGESFRSDAPPVAPEAVPSPPELASAKRGSILAADGTPLAETRSVEVLAVWFPHLEDGLRKPMVQEICRLQGISVETWQEHRRAILEKVRRITESVNRRRDRRQYPEPIRVAEAEQWHPILEAPTPALVEAVRGDRERFSPLAIVPGRRRVYPRQAVAGHVVGHLGAPEDDGSERRIGCAGLEAALEEKLRPKGQQGGDSVRVTLDLSWQQLARELLREHSADAAGGAFLVLDLQNDALRVLASWPSYDPNLFESHDVALIETLLSDSHKPLFRRATDAALPIGSIAKPVTAAALLEEGVIVPETLFYCRGYLDEPGSLRCDRFPTTGTGHGDVTCSDALCESCNVFFFHYVEPWQGADTLSRYWRRFGFGRPVGICLPEASGHLPEQGDVRQWAIGQGGFLATPLQVARMIGIVATGRDVRPRLLISEASSMKDAALAEIDPATWSTVRGGLRRVVEDRFGTAHAAMGDLPVAVAGKTGTAEVEGKPSHAWFAGYWPAETPRYAIVVLLEHAGRASETACKAAADFLRTIASPEH